MQWGSHFCVPNKRKELDWFMHGNGIELLKCLNSGHKNCCRNIWPKKKQTNKNWGLGPVSRTSRELFGPEKLVVKLQSACFEKLIFLHAFNIRKIKRIAKFQGLEPRRCEDTKGIVVPDICPKSFGTWETGPWEQKDLLVPFTGKKKTANNFAPGKVTFTLTMSNV